MRTFVFTCLLLLGMTIFAQDANFHIYLCLGQSNMEGNAKVEEQDTVAVDSRFQVLAADNPKSFKRLSYTPFTFKGQSLSFVFDSP